MCTSYKTISSSETFYDPNPTQDPAYLHDVICKCAILKQDQEYGRSHLKATKGGQYIRILDNDILSEIPDYELYMSSKKGNKELYVSSIHLYLESLMLGSKTETHIYDNEVRADGYVPALKKIVEHKRCIGTPLQVFRAFIEALCYVRLAKKCKHSLQDAQLLQATFGDFKSYWLELKDVSGELIDFVEMQLGYGVNPSTIASSIPYIQERFQKHIEDCYMRHSSASVLDPEYAKCVIFDQYNAINPQNIYGK